MMSLCRPQILPLQRLHLLLLEVAEEKGVERGVASGKGRQRADTRDRYESLSKHLSLTHHHIKAYNHLNLLDAVSAHAWGSSARSQGDQPSLATVPTREPSFNLLRALPSKYD